MKKIKFVSNEDGDKFFRELKKEVNNYFVSNKITQFADNEMKFKCILWISLWAISWAGVIYFKDQFYIAFSFGFLHMFTHLMIAFNIAHDANHSALFSSRKVNNFLGNFMELIGVNKKMWLIGHNNEHHSYINVHEHDNNIDGHNILRLSPNDQWKKHHRFQWLYATIIYGLSTLHYSTIRDFKLLKKYDSNKEINSFRFVGEMLLFKLLYFSYLFIVPIFVFGVSLKLILAYFLLGHFINGIALVFIFLTGHLTENTSYVKPIHETINKNWAVHVIQSTGDYSTNSKIMSWFIGSLNLHVAHHLFPKVCHVHYKNISPIIKAVATKHGLTYREAPSFTNALSSHFQLLWNLGRSTT